MLFFLFAFGPLVEAGRGGGASGVAATAAGSGGAEISNEKDAFSKRMRYKTVKKRSPLTSFRVRFAMLMSCLNFRISLEMLLLRQETDLVRILSRRE